MTVAKRSWLPAVGLAVLLGCRPSLSQPAESLAPNPSAEEGRDGQPAGWSFYSWKDAQGWWDDQQARSGARSLGLKGLNGGWTAAVPVTPGQVYNVRFHYRAEGPPGRVVLYVRELAGKQVRKLHIYKPQLTIGADQPARFEQGVLVEGADERGWVVFEGGDFVPTDEGREVSMLIKIDGRQPGTQLWLDDLVVTGRAPRTAPLTARRLAEAGGTVVFTDDANVKILPEQAPPTESAEGIDLAAAGGEYETFQVALTPSRSLPRVDWTWTAFAGPRPLPAEALTCRLVECVNLTRTTGPYSHQGLNPDPLTDRLPADLAAGRTTGFWFAVKVPADQPPGRYTTAVTVRRDGQPLASVPVTLTVRGFAIPSRPSLDVRSQSRWELVRPRESGDWEQVLARYRDSFFEHRTRCLPVSRINVQLRGDEAVVDAAAYLAELKLLRDRYGLDRVDLPALWIGHKGTHKMPADAAWQGRRIFADESLTKLDPGFEKPFRGFLGQLCKLLRAEGLWLHPTVRYFDEPNLLDPPTRAGLKALAELINAIEPEITVTLTASDPVPELTGCIKYWVLHTDAWDRSRPNIEAARRAGCRISVYNNAVDLPEHRPLRTRLWPWLLWKYRVDGTYSWWGTVCWRGEMENPWTCGQGDSGVLLYPPRGPDEHGPIESVRWELFREGLEDYEYLALADRLAGELEQAGKAGAARPGRQAVAQAMGLVERWPNVQSANDEPYTIDPTQVAAARQALAAAIESMRGALGR